MPPMARAFSTTPLLIVLCLGACRGRLVDFVPPSLCCLGDEAEDPKSYQTTTPALLAERFRQELARGRDPVSLYDSTAARIVLADLAIRDGDVVADIGCGTGALEIRLVTGGSPFGALYAVDIDQPSLDFLGMALEMVDREHLRNVVLVPSARDDVRLPPASVDLMVSIDSRLGMRPLDGPMGERALEDRDRLMKSMLGSLKPGGRLVVVEPALWSGGRAYPDEWVQEPFLENGFELLEFRALVLDEERCVLAVFGPRKA